MKIPYKDSPHPDLWRAVVVRQLPDEDVDRGLLDRKIIIDVDLPPGSASGPPIDRDELSLLRRVSGPRFRAYLAAQSVQWQPGRTRIPHPKNRAVHVWHGDRDRYAVLTAEDRARLVYGPGWARPASAKHGSAAADDAWERLPGSVILTKRATTPDGKMGWLIVPEDAAKAIRTRERK